MMIQHRKSAKWASESVLSLSIIDCLIWVMQFCSEAFPQRGEASQLESPSIFLWLLTYIRIHTRFCIPLLPKSLWRLFGNLLLEVKEELVVWQGRLCPVLNHVLHKAGLPLALIPERANHRKKNKNDSCVSFPFKTWQNEFHNHLVSQTAGWVLIHISTKCPLNHCC